MAGTQISEFGEILLFIIGGIFFLMGGLITAWLIRPNRPNEEKLTTYECGDEPVGTAWGRFNIRFYIIAVIFVLFDVELVFLFPWATVFGQKVLIEQTHGMWGWFTIFEMFLFIGILALGLAYAWVKGDLDWEKPKAVVPSFESAIPQSAYKHINARTHSVKKGKSKETEN
ncbi:NADH-quinone oxidoreductase subunit A [Xanthovirga aplysinae]|uniref:NADH-quinone oxidoreductase subunit A n=1 Tax=Xanthovirga aplysinae TaxID=2529853 RepID=UPI0012BCE991|nr:NADH-quinone oxidoreductase subunit A [Xanthovirga aplysinae]MTI32898.1 NADH-quinone oxidoreductase subunit A [Xanthovirga aplysinae]